MVPCVCGSHVAVGHGQTCSIVGSRPNLSLVSTINLNLHASALCVLSYLGQRRWWLVHTSVLVLFFIFFCFALVGFDLFWSGLVVAVRIYQPDCFVCLFLFCSVDYCLLCCCLGLLFSIEVCVWSFSSLCVCLSL